MLMVYETCADYHAARFGNTAQNHRTARWNELHATTRQYPGRVIRGSMQGPVSFNEVSHEIFTCDVSGRCIDHGHICRHSRSPPWERSTRRSTDDHSGAHDQSATPYRPGIEHVARPTSSTDGTTQRQLRQCERTQYTGQFRDGPRLGI